MKQYFSYFKIWFIILGVLIVITGGAGIVRSMMTGNYVRRNAEAPKERVYDFADVLSDAEEERLRELISRREAQIGCDIVLVVINESVLEKYGYTRNTDSYYYNAMMQYADDFYDDHRFGFNKSFEGDGVLLLDNWYVGEYGSEKGTWLSTSGRVYQRYTDAMVDRVLDDVYDRVKNNPYKAYESYIENVYRDMSGGSIGIKLNGFLLFVISVIAAGVFVATHLKSKEGEKTTVASTYVENGSVRFNVQRDEFVTKHVTSTVIQSNSGSGGHSSGRSGGHVSRSGAHHGGGGRRR